jgi:hypothetical protein
VDVVVTVLDVVVMVDGAVVVVGTSHLVRKMRCLQAAERTCALMAERVTCAAQLTKAPCLRAGQHSVCIVASVSATPTPSHLDARLLCALMQSTMSARVMLARFFIVRLPLEQRVCLQNFATPTRGFEVQDSHGRQDKQPWNCGNVRSRSHALRSHMARLGPGGLSS